MTTKTKFKKGDVLISRDGKIFQFIQATEHEHRLALSQWFAHIEQIARLASVLKMSNSILCLRKMFTQIILVFFFAIIILIKENAKDA